MKRIAAHGALRQKGKLPRRVSDPVGHLAPGRIDTVARAHQLVVAPRAVKRGPSHNAPEGTYGHGHISGYLFFIEVPGINECV